MPLPAAHSRLSYTSPRRSTEARGYFCLEITWRLENKGAGKRSKSEKGRKKTSLEFSTPLSPKERIWEFEAP
uniref:Uncharacterized protein n=1 Tax=Saimiri boliviensis boliviensis TaxID=39432 RepID=A0A2K6T404_SAIBB